MQDALGNIDTPEFRERLRGLGIVLDVHSDGYKLLVGYVNRTMSAQQSASQKTNSATAKPAKNPILLRDDVVRSITEARDIAERNFTDTDVPTSAEFGEIAQHLTWVIDCATKPAHALVAQPAGNEYSLDVFQDLMLLSLSFRDKMYFSVADELERMAIRGPEEMKDFAHLSNNDILELVAQRMNGQKAGVSEKHPSTADIDDQMSDMLAADAEQSGEIREMSPANQWLALQGWNTAKRATIEQ